MEANADVFLFPFNFKEWNQQLHDACFVYVQW